MKKKAQTKLFLFLFSAILIAEVFAFPFSTDAKNLQYSSPSEITIRAKVPLMPEFVYLISKNSKINLPEKNVKVSEEINFSVELLGYQNKPLRNQKVYAEIKNNKTGEVIKLHPLEINEKSVAQFSFAVEEKMLGKNTITGFISTYGEPIEIRKSENFKVKTNNFILDLFK